jgi:hypothetical protein
MNLISLIDDKVNFEGKVAQIDVPVKRFRIGQMEKFEDGKTPILPAQPDQPAA